MMNLLFPQWSGVGETSRLDPTVICIYDPSLGPSGAFRPAKTTDFPGGSGGGGGSVTVSGGGGPASQSGVWSVLAAQSGVYSVLAAQSGTWVISTSPSGTVDVNQVTSRYLHSAARVQSYLANSGSSGTFFQAFGYNNSVAPQFVGVYDGPNSGAPIISVQKVAATDNWFIDMENHGIPYLSGIFVQSLFADTGIATGSADLTITVQYR